jgi:pyridoxamine 5'-phosphate oxidase
MKYASVRKEYQEFTLMENDLKESPFDMFEEWFLFALKTDLENANAMVLSTLSSEGWPQGRVVLLKGVDSGFVWFSNYQSAKGRDLDFLPKASLTFWWPAPARQVRVYGNVEKISEKESVDYFLSRPRGSQAGALASLQSSLIESRDKLERDFQSFLEGPESEPFMKPSYWGGYRLLPEYFEFWQGRESRLHDRLFYKKTDNHWTTGRLSP